MRLRSLLFVPGDRPDRMEKALIAGADALILDLEDSVAAERKPMARDAVGEFLRERRGQGVFFVRVNPVGSAAFAADLPALAGALPLGIVIPKAEGERTMLEVERALCRLELEAGVHARSIKALPIATETPAAVFRLGEYARVRSRLIGLTWGAEDLPAVIGARSSRNEDGTYTPPYELARSLALFGAAAAGVAAVETVYPNYRDLDGLAAYVARGARDGFSGMLAIHPAQVPIINAGFSPTEIEIQAAREIVSAFEAAPGAGVVSLEGRMLDRPHLIQALRLLARAGQA